MRLDPRGLRDRRIDTDAIPSFDGRYRQTDSDLEWCADRTCGQPLKSRMRDESQLAEPTSVLAHGVTCYFTVSNGTIGIDHHNETVGVRPEVKMSDHAG